jgi:Tfp pilus assembly protein PilF
MEAEIENQVFEKEESNFPWKEEMEQDVSESIDPAKELSRAYRYIRKDETRIAIIYLDHLVKKYPNWSDVYYLRALGFQRMHYVDRMMKDLEKACFLNNQEACNELRALK